MKIERIRVGRCRSTKNKGMCLCSKSNPWIPLAIRPMLALPSLGGHCHAVPPREMNNHWQFPLKGSKSKLFSKGKTA